MNQPLQPDEIETMVQADMDDMSSTGSAGSVGTSCPNSTIEYGIFFDGTGNNSDNYLLGQEMRANGEATSGSYNNDLSNINKLEKVYNKRPVNADGGGVCIITDSEYIPGIGTLSGSSDSRIDTGLGNATGVGPTGVQRRVFDGFSRLKRFIFAQSAQGQIKEVKIDVFGFSRGAAAARHFVNMVNQGYMYDTSYNPPQKVDLVRAFDGDDEILPLANVKVRFVGLFDTVASIGPIADNDINLGANLHLAKGSADYIYHIVAADEFRKNFGVTNIQGSECDEVVIPGAHSDIGGGYPAHFDENIHIETVTTSLWRQVRQRILANTKTGIIGRLVSQGWIYPHEIEEALSIVHDRGAIGVYHVVLNRPWVDHRLSRVALHMMHKKALDEGVPFAGVLPGNDDYALPADLAALQARLYKGIPASPTQHYTLRHDYTHYSSHLNVIGGVQPMKPQDGYRRSVFDNDPSKAITR